MTPPFRALVTGAGGFVGRNIVRVLLETGCYVVALDRVYDEDLRRAWLERWSTELDLIEAETSRLPGYAVDGIIHAAALTATAEESHQAPEAHLRANLDPLLDVLEWAERQGVRRTIVLSSDAVFRSSQPGSIAEATPVSPLGLYAVAKSTAEQLCETLRKQHQRDVVAVRLGNIYGPQERSRQTRPRVSLANRMVNNAMQYGMLRVFEGEPASDWTYAPDVGRALFALLKAPLLQHHLYHVASEQLFTPLDIAQAIKAILPETTLEIRKGSDPGRQSETRLGYLSSERMRREFAFDQWTPFSEGLQSVINWQQAEMAQ
jgi:UDP-glucose 4-epimerase